MSSLLASVLASVSSLAAEEPQEPWFTECSHHSEHEAAVAQKKWQQIEQAIAAEHDAWAGQYMTGHGMTERADFIWAPTVGFVAVWTGCCPGVLDLNYGSVERTAQGIRVRAEFPTRRKRYPVAPEFLFVTWGERHYLVPADEIAAFCDFVAGLDADVDPDLRGQFLLRSGDWKKPAEGDPELPPGFEKYVRKPIEATITGIRRSRAEFAKITLNVGSVDGVKPGMIFNAITADVWATATVLSVRKYTAVAELYDDSDPSLAVGLKLSSKTRSPGSDP